MSDPRTASSRLLPTGLVFSDTPSRLVAFLLDGLVLTPIYLVILALVGFDLMTVRPGAFPDRNVWILGSVLTLVLNALYFVLFWSGGRRATPGQRVMGIQVANAFDGQPLSYAQAFNRYLAMGQWSALPSLLPYLSVAVLTLIASYAWYLVLTASAMVSPTKQALHDRYAGSAVVRPAGAGNRWAVGCLGAFIVLVVVEALIFAFVLTSMPPSMQSDSMIRYMEETFRWFWPQ